MNVLFFYLLNVSIPQAVSAVATILNANKGGDVTFVSIPQAVSAVATKLLSELWVIVPKEYSFNTASGKCCCNHFISTIDVLNTWSVSIPQAVSAVATAKYIPPVYMYVFRVSIPQAVSAVATVSIRYISL